MFKSAGSIRWLLRGLRRAAPVIVWVGALGAAISLYPRRLSSGSFIGYAEDLSVIVTHTEPSIVRELGTRLHEIVQPGDVLIRLDDREDRLAIDTIAADVERLKREVEAERAKLELDVANIEINAADLARRFLTDREAAHVQYLSALVTQASDQSLLSGMLVEYDILKRLFDTDQAAFRELNAFETQIEPVRARVEKNRANVERMLQAYEDADKRWFAFVDRQETPVDYESVLTPVRLAVDVREREINELVFRIDQRVLRSPIHGQVTAMYVQSGDRVLAGLPLMVVSPVRTNRVVAYLPENQVALASVGDPVKLYPTSAGPDGPRSFDGQICSVADAVREAPLRFRRMPTWPVWGREVIIELRSNALLPGEAVSLVVQR